MTSSAHCESPSSPRQKRFQNQSVIVTGASKGIGRGIASCFADEGAHVLLVGRDKAALEATLKAICDRGGSASFFQGDVSSAKDMESMAECARSRYGTIDILCANAGIYTHARLDQMSLEEWQKEWQRTIDTNLTGVFLSLKVCLSAMVEQKKGKIVITSSISGPRTALPGYAHYTASKGGVAGFVRTAAVELAKHNITVNAVEPGNIITEGFDVLGAEHLNNMLKAVPMGRLGTPKDVADAVMFLASDAASYITGQSIIVDGGQTLPESHFAAY